MRSQKNAIGCCRHDWQDLVHLSDAELGCMDVAAVNLACAADLPNAEDLDVGACLQVIDVWAEVIRGETQRLLPQFEKLPERFQYSEPFFRMLVLVTVLQRDLGIRGDPTYPDKNQGELFRDSRLLFLHGLVHGIPGTCSNRPVLYVAIGRRLGYPLRLVRTAQHMFARWLEPGRARFNIECTVPGLKCPPDEYYLHWPCVVSPDEMRLTIYLKSLTPREELAVFLLQRAHTLFTYGRYKEAVKACTPCVTLSPLHRLHEHSLRRYLDCWGKDVQAWFPPVFPRLTVNCPNHWSGHLPEELKKEIVRLEAMEMLLKDPEHEQNWWEPMRRSPGQLPGGFPKELLVNLVPNQTRRDRSLS